MSVLTWWQLSWPREVETDWLLAVLRHLAASPIRPIVLEAEGASGEVVHRVGLPGRDRDVLAALRTQLPGADAIETDRDLGALDGAVRLQLSSQTRPIQSDEPQLTARTLVRHLSSAGQDERLVLQWILDRPLSPQLVGGNVSRRSLQSWPEALADAPWRGDDKADSVLVRALRDKRSAPGFRAIGRIAVRAASRPRQRQLIAGVISALRTSNGPGVGWRAISTPPYRAAEVRLGWTPRLSLNLAELASVCGWPLGVTSELPIVSRQSRALPPPAPLVSSKRVIGESTVPPQRKVSLEIGGAMMHLAITAPTGTGKSTLLANLALQDADADRGVVVVDPKGDLIDDILARLPEDRLDDVVVVDPTSERPLGLNPLDTTHRSAEAAADQLLVVFRNLFAGYWGPRTQDILHASALTLARTPGMTLVALPLLLTDDGFRRRIVGKVNDPFGVSAFWSTYESWSPAERATNIAPALTRLRPFLMRPGLRRMLGQAEPAWSIDEVFTERRIVLVDLADQDLGADGAKLLGSLIVAELWQAVLRRGRIEPARRHPVVIVADEFQDYCHFAQDFEAALAKSRSFGVGWTLAHQHLDQLTPSIKAALQSNARSKLLFQLGADDARALTRSDPVLAPADLQGLPVYEAYARLMSGGTVQPWCSIRTLPLPARSNDPAQLRQRSAKRWGRSIDEIDAELNGLLTAGSSSVENDLAPRKRPRKGGE